jgi:anti-anti-sigma factor
MVRKVTATKKADSAGYALERNGVRVVIPLLDRLVAADVPGLQTLLKQELAAGVREIVFDLARTETLDSSGIGLLIAANNSAMGRQGSVQLTNVADEILHLLQSMRLVERLHASGRPGR